MLFLFIGYTLVFAVIMLYVFRLISRLSRLEREVQRMRGTGNGGSDR